MSILLVALKELTKYWGFSTPPFPTNNQQVAPSCCFPALGALSLVRLAAHGSWESTERTCSVDSSAKTLLRLLPLHKTLCDSSTTQHRLSSKLPARKKRKQESKQASKQASKHAGRQAGGQVGEEAEKRYT